MQTRSPRVHGSERCTIILEDARSLAWDANRLRMAHAITLSLVALVTVPKRSSQDSSVERGEVRKCGPCDRPTRVTIAISHSVQDDPNIPRFPRSANARSETKYSENRASVVCPRRRNVNGSRTFRKFGQVIRENSRSENFAILPYREESEPSVDLSKRRLRNRNWRFFNCHCRCA